MTGPIYGAIHIALRKGNFLRKHGTSHSGQLNRLKRIQGQISGIIKMIEDRRYCIDILTQVKAAKSALNAVETSLLESHMNHCVQDALKAKNSRQADEMISEIKKLLKKS